MKAVDQAERHIQPGARVHLIGTGGMGMAGIAFLLKERGLSVSGCDLQESRQTDWLRENHVPIFLGHAEGHITADTDWLIRSTAVLDTHPEVQQARALGIPVSRRGEVLPALLRDRTSIAVCGTHGKTTTTAMIAQVLDCGYYIGGERVGAKGMAKAGSLMVVEADESDGTLVGYTPDYAVITNIEYDHMEHHASEAAFVGCFEQLIENTRIKVYYCADDPLSQRLCAGNPKCEPFFFPDPRIPQPLLGDHNQWNAAATQAVCERWKSKPEIAQALNHMPALRRRFETVFNEGEIRIISDYAHHPTEVSALVKTALALKPKRLLGLFQPHRYTRTRAFGTDFPTSFWGIDQLWVVPVYAASESPMEGGSALDLIDHFPARWGNNLHYFPQIKSAWSAIQAELRAGDLLLIIGAGDIDQVLTKP